MSPVGDQPSQAAEELATQATAAGCPTTASQVEELTKRRILPSPLVPRRGRGVTTSVYPPDALGTLIAVRKAKAIKGFRQLRRAVVLAWLGGADIRDEGLTTALLDVIDEVHLGMTNGFPRKHVRRNPEARFDPPIDNPADRSIVLGVIAQLMAGGHPPAALATFAADLLTPLLEQFSTDDDPKTGERLPVPVDQAQLGTFLTGRDAWPDDGQGVDVIDLSVTTLRAFVARASRDTLDQARDVALQTQGDVPLTSPDDLFGFMGMLLGVLGGFAAAYEQRSRPRSP